MQDEINMKGLGRLVTISQRNQLANAHNRYQGNTPKALCVCSAGLLRSPSIAKYLTEQGFNTRACGTSQDYALVPLSTALMEWADYIFVVDGEERLVKEVVSTLSLDKPIYSLPIPDMYGTFDPKLMEIIDELVSPIVKEIKGE